MTLFAFPPRYVIIPLIRIKCFSRNFNCGSIKNAEEGRWLHIKKMNFFVENDKKENGGGKLTATGQSSGWSWLSSHNLNIKCLLALSGEHHT